MKEEYMRCMRCNGRKKVFKIMGGYSHINSGGIEKDCPLCLGKGEVKTIDAAISDAVRNLRPPFKEEEEVAETKKRGRPSRKTNVQPEL
jgi:hypothetical protein